MSKHNPTTPHPDSPNSISFTVHINSPTQSPSRFPSLHTPLSSSPPHKVTRSS
ncbi:hypothetical protein BJ508DRAFT_419565 [Ascobolus immersus RN42]|uniref:Uncharacterized protein n=1 Tax=Ascobolus immersus RN42 TaxID=1160509 RepID=A0A3N4HK02_ASCIM|nr:hypothetical protein BJ508DRAFT_419565 [Ascobolus immersus RN42]